MPDTNTRLWIKFNETNAILKHYERNNVIGKSRIYAEANFFRAAQAVWSQAFAPLRQV